MLVSFTMLLKDFSSSVKTALSYIFMVYS